MLESPIIHSFLTSARNSDEVALNETVEYRMHIRLEQFFWPTSLSIFLKLNGLQWTTKRTVMTLNELMTLFSPESFATAGVLVRSY